MTTGAIIMFAFGATLLWGGLAVALTIAVVKSKKNTSTSSNFKKDAKARA